MGTMAGHPDGQPQSKWGVGRVLGDDQMPQDEDDSVNSGLKSAAKSITGGLALGKSNASYNYREGDAGGVV